MVVLLLLLLLLLLMWREDIDQCVCVEILYWRVKTMYIEIGRIIMCGPLLDDNDINDNYSQYYY